MKTRITLVCVVFLLIGHPSALAQKKKATKKGISTAWTLHKELGAMIDNAKFKGKITGPCYPTSYFKKLTKKDIISNPKTIGGNNMDKLSSILLPLNKLKTNNQYGFMPIYSFIKSKSYVEFVNNLYSKNIGDLRPASFAKDVDSYYRELKKVKKDGVIIETKTVHKKPCSYKIETRFKVDKWDGTFDTGVKWVNYKATLTGKLIVNVKIECDCKGKSTGALKDADYTYEMPSKLGIEFTNRGNKQRFIPETKRENTLTLNKVNCCTEGDISFEDPNLEVLPTENISTPNSVMKELDTNQPATDPPHFLEAQAGLATAKDEETLFCIGLGALFHVTTLGGNPLFAGAQASLHTSSFGVQNFKSNNIKLGPVLEYRVPLGSTSTDLIFGAKGGFNFGSQESAGFITDITGFNAGLYSGVHVPLGDNLALGVLIDLLNYNNLTFKAEDDSFENKRTNTGFNFNKGSAKLSLRFNLFNGSGKI